MTLTRNMHPHCSNSSTFTPVTMTLVCCQHHEYQVWSTEPDHPMLITLSLSDDCQLVSDVGRCRLRSSDVSTCVVPRTHTGFGDRAFQVAGPRLWNSLSASLRQSDTTVGQFKKLLKTHLFSWDCGALVTVAFTVPRINISTTTTTTTAVCLPHRIRLWHF